MPLKVLVYAYTQTTELPLGLNTVVDWETRKRKSLQPGFKKGETLGRMLWRLAELAQDGLIEHTWTWPKKNGVWNGSQ